MGVPGGHPIWLHIHVPYCPQSCAYCHCGRQQLADRSQLDGWLERTRAEVEFFAPVLAGTSVRQEYFGGGTPNLLSPDQLEVLFTLVETHFDHGSVARRTFEMLPSAYRPGSLEVVARHGIRRLSCGVQSTGTDVLKRAGRQSDFARLGSLMEEARGRGIDDVNLDLAWGLKGESEEGLFQSLDNVLALQPTSISVHLISPTAKNPMFETEAEAIAMYRRFRALPHGPHGRRLIELWPEYTWRELPTVMVVLRKDYVDAGRYRTWQYSDTEAVGIDQFGIGRHAGSHLLGWARFMNMTDVERFDPDEAGYLLSQADAVVDGAMDALAGLMRDDYFDFAAIAGYYGVQAVSPVRAAIEELVAEGQIHRDGSFYRCSPGAGGYMRPAELALFDLATSRAEAIEKGSRSAQSPAPADVERRAPA